MPMNHDPEDTANLHGDSGSSVSGRVTADDTDRLAIWHSHQASAPQRSPTEAHPYAEGIIRFYRARTILESDRSEPSWSRAWRYLDRLSPQDLPPPTRRRFLELVYFVQEQEGRPTFAAHEFRLRVRLIAELIDSFVDELNDRFDA